MLVLNSVVLIHNSSLIRVVAQKAERDLNRIRPLYAQNAATQLDLDNAVRDRYLAIVALYKALGGWPPGPIHN